MICTDGSIYTSPAAAESASKTAVAMIAYVNTEHKTGLAIALKDVAKHYLSWDKTFEKNNGKTATEWFDDWKINNPISCGIWKIPSREEWENIFQGCGGSPIESTDNYYDYGNLLDMSVDLGIRSDAMYWTSTPRSENPEEYQIIYNFNIKMFGGRGISSSVTRLRACLVFEVGTPTITLSEKDDNSTFIKTNNGKIYDVTLTRTLKAGSWNTFSVPFTVYHDQLASIFGENVKLKMLRSSSYSDGNLTLNFTEGWNLTAGMAFLIKVESDVVNPTFPNVTINDYIYPGNPENPWIYADFLPVINPVTLTSGAKTDLFVIFGNKLTHPVGGSTINGFRGYFHLQGDAVETRTFTLNIDDETTGINAISNAQETIDSAVYNMKGQRVTNPAKGIYVKNGKKVIIK